MDSSFLSWDKAATDPSGPVSIPPIKVLLCMLPLSIFILVSSHIGLGLHRKLSIAVVRCALQLSVVGYILGPILMVNKPWVTFCYTMFMLCMAAAEAVSRPTHSYNGMIFIVLLLLGIASSITIFFGLAVVVNISPWWEAGYLIPMLGMLMGNGLSSIAVGLTAVLDELINSREKIEALLALGASRFEATRDVVRKSVRLAFTPLLNNMSVVGVVSIPGMMSGQILGGSDPTIAARYQIVIFYLVALASSTAATAIIYASITVVMDDHHRLRLERLHTRASQTKGALAWIAAQMMMAASALRSTVARFKNGIISRLQRSPQSRQRHYYFGYRRSSSVQSDIEVADSSVPTEQEPLLEPPSRDNPDDGSQGQS